MGQAMNNAAKCEFCDKRGLPLLLVRDGVSPAGAGAPLASALSIELSAKAAHYTKRLLRSGYVNVFDEARRRWETYFVTLDGYLYKLMHTPGVTPVIPTKPFNCPDEGHRAIASCITIPDPSHADKVWIGFSDALWTDTVRAANEDPGYRKRHMIEVDIKAVLQERNTSHRSIAQLDTVVAEYAMTPNLARANFSWSRFKFNSRFGQADRLKLECESMRPRKGIIVTVPDPAGVAQELASLMKRNAELFITARPIDQRNLAASVAIDQIEEAIRMQGQHTEIAAAEQIADQRVEASPIEHWLSESTRAKTESFRTVTVRHLESAADAAWNKYAKKFDDVARKAWKVPFKKRLEEFDAVFIAPLALNHVAWMKSSSLADYFECNYDPFHPESGAVYTRVFTDCISATEDKKACADLYVEWLAGRVSDTKNLLLRSMLLNQEIPAKAVDDATASGPNVDGIPWDNIFAAFSGVVDRLSQQAQTGLAQLVVEISGAVASVFGKVMDGSTGFRAAVMATGLISGHPIVVCNVVGTKGQFRAHLIKELLRTSGQDISKGQMKRAVIAELKRQQIQGVSLEGSGAKRWVLVADKAMIDRMPPGLSPQARADWLARSLKTIEEVEALNLQRWRTVVNADVRSGFVTGILQALSLVKLFADEENSLTHDKKDALGRLHAGIAAIVGTTAEAISHALKGRSLSLRFGQGLANNAATVLKWSGRVVGLVGGLYVAVLDIHKAREARREGNKGLAVLYYSSAVIGATLSAALIATQWLVALAVPIIGVLVLLLVGIGIWIEYVKDNPLQDWLERCPWGIFNNERYADLATLQDQLNKALK
jgi:hypothetical protein